MPRAIERGALRLGTRAMTERMTAADFVQAGAKRPARNKYAAVRTEAGGRKFDSKKEAHRYMDLRMLERSGAIADLRCQVRFELMGQDGPLLTEKGNPHVYIADFVYRDTKTSQFLIEDVKGLRTPEYRLKKACMRSMGYSILET
jgi:hypothetical protein